MRSIDTITGAGAGAPAASRTRRRFTSARVAMLSGLLPIAAEAPLTDPLDEGMDDSLRDSGGAPTNVQWFRAGLRAGMPANPRRRSPAIACVSVRRSRAVEDQRTGRAIKPILEVTAI